ncbi:hypothetical protein [Eisenibacter elegans]|jgi:tetratricopeptide (TPR) repeat protein|uniref:hypothetical protein n=1 Tax=Eisenibacter elegans TaxID=997 RepID=UPI00040F1B18|nr:hypothetical protein [Eisenibacter elegans]
MKNLYYGLLLGFCLGASVQAQTANSLVNVPGVSPDTLATLLQKIYQTDPPNELQLGSIYYQGAAWYAKQASPNYTTVIDLLRKSETHYAEAEAVENVAHINIALAEYYLLLGIPQRSLACLQKAHQFFQDLSQTNNVAIVDVLLGSYYLQHADAALAKVYYQKALPYLSSPLKEEVAAQLASMAEEQR